MLASVRAADVDHGTTATPRRQRRRHHGEARAPQGGRQPAARRQRHARRRDGCAAPDARAGAAQRLLPRKRRDGTSGRARRPCSDLGAAAVHLVETQGERRDLRRGGQLRLAEGSAPGHLERASMAQEQPRIGGAGRAPPPPSGRRGSARHRARGARAGARGVLREQAAAAKGHGNLRKEGEADGTGSGHAAAPRRRAGSPRRRGRGPRVPAEDQPPQGPARSARASVAARRSAYLDELRVAGARKTDAEADPGDGDSDAPSTPAAGTAQTRCGVDAGCMTDLGWEATSGEVLALRARVKEMQSKLDAASVAPTPGAAAAADPPTQTSAEAGLLAAVQASSTRRTVWSRPSPSRRAAPRTARRRSGAGGGRGWAMPAPACRGRCPQPDAEPRLLPPQRVAMLPYTHTRCRGCQRAQHALRPVQLRPDGQRSRQRRRQPQQQQRGGAGAAATSCKRAKHVLQM